METYDVLQMKFCDVSHTKSFQCTANVYRISKQCSLVPPLSGCPGDHALKYRCPFLISAKRMTIYMIVCFIMFNF